MNATKPSPQHASHRRESTAIGDDQTRISSLQATARQWQPSLSSTFSVVSATTDSLSNHKYVAYHKQRPFEDSPVRYLNFRVAVPCNSSTDEIVNYVQSTFGSGIKYGETVETGLTTSAATSEQYRRHALMNETDIRHFRDNKIASHSFLPMSNVNTKSVTNYGDDSHRRLSSSFSPIKVDSSCGKTSPSPSNKTLETAELTESSCYSSFSTPASSRNCSPASFGYDAFQPQFYRQQQVPYSFSRIEEYCIDIKNETNFKASYESESFSDNRSFPSQRDRKSVVTSAVSDESELRKPRIKTELCMHYKNGSNCPFGSSK